ncbi:MAG: methyltransferase domain-containing protein [Acidimicrobiia bacterium]
MERRIRSHLARTLGGVLPPHPARGLEWYYDWVVVGNRSLEALRVLREHRPRRADGLLVDVGSGLGSVVILANACGMRAVGVEPAAADVELARERAAVALPDRAGLFAVGRGEALPVESGTATAVLLYDVLEHTPTWKEVLAECRRVLAPDGVLYVKGPAYGFRFFEPHYRVAWLPLLRPTLARRYLRLMGRDDRYLDEVHYVRRKPVLRELDRLGLSLSFPRQARADDPESIRRGWVRSALRVAHHVPGGRSAAAALAEGPLQATIDVVARPLR